jgi:tRNA(fMet)-specific endonuclease VapC
MRYLLDTNIVSDLIRNPNGAVAEQIRELGQARVCTSTIVAAELRYGAAKKKSPQLATRIDAVLAALEVVPFDPPSDTAYGLIRARLESIGALIGANDLLIGAHALTLGCVLVTANKAEFARIEGLTVENWLRDF